MRSQVIVRRLAAMVCVLLLVCVFPAAAGEASTPLVIGETFLIDSAALGEQRRIAVYFPPGFSARSETPLPVLYMPDGGPAEDFLHVAGLIQVSVSNGTMRPVLLVGIENTERRRDMTGPTENDEDRKIAPRVGGSAVYRAFLRKELMPAIRKRYRTTDESGIVGESLAGLFVVETFLLEPRLFDTYIAIDPSLWWNNSRYLRDAQALLAATAHAGKSLFIANSGQPSLAEEGRSFAELLNRLALPGLRHAYLSLPDETHGTIYHPAAIKAFRWALAPVAPGAAQPGG